MTIPLSSSSNLNRRCARFSAACFRCFVAAALTTVTISKLEAQVPNLPAYLDHTNLLVLRDAAGREVPIQNEADWAVRRAHIVASFEKVAGKFPGGERRVPLDLKIGASTDEGAFTRLQISYAVEPGDRATAWLLLPKGIRPNERRAGVLALHQTTKIGKDEPAGIGGLTNLNYGKELAQRGHVVLCPDYHRYGERTVDPYKMGWDSATMKGIWDHMRAVDVLASRPEVDAKRIVAIGHSLGGHNSIFVALFDDRIKAVVSSCGYNAFPNYYEGQIAGWSHDGYMPRLKNIYHLDLKAVPFDWPELVAAIAPRGLFTNAPKRDDNFSLQGVKVCEQSARPVYDLFGAGKKLVYVHPDAPHDFPPEVRQQAYQFLESQMQKD